MLKRFSDLPGDHEAEHRARDGERQDREHRDRMEERVELAREHHVRDEDADREREPEAARRLLELRGLAAGDDAIADAAAPSRARDLRHRLGLRVARADVAGDADRALAVEAADRLEDRLLLLRHDQRHRDELPALRRARG